MKEQEILDQISKLNLSEIKDNLHRKTFELMLNLIENLILDKTQLKELNQSLRDEINILKGEQGKPNIKANTRPKSNDISTGGKEVKKKKHDKKPKKLDIKIHKTIKLTLNKEQLPKDAIFKYWEEKISQNIIFEVQNTLYKIGVYHSASLGKTFRPEPPKEASYHNLNLQSFILILNKVLDATESRILMLLKSIGIQISAGSLSKILLAHTDIADKEKQDILKAGLSSSFVQTDITGARVCGKNNYSNIITNQYFTSYTTTVGKSHLDVLAAFQGLNDKNKLKLRYDAMAIQNLEKAKISKNDLQKLDRVLERCDNFTLEFFIQFIKQKIPDLDKKKNIFIKVKAALARAYYSHQTQIPRVYCLVSDNAPEYNNISMEDQALCWVHDARYYKKINPVLDIHKAKLNNFLDAYWSFYYKLLDYKNTPSTELKSKLSKEFDKLFTSKTNYFQLDKLMEKTYKNKNKLLTVLKKPEIPLHNNHAELGVRRKVRKRDISFHTMSDRGTICLDAFMTITQTAMQLNVDVFQYIKQMINQDQDRVLLADLIHQKINASVF